MIKPMLFGLIIGLIACYKGLDTKGGTVGVGISTTNAVVRRSITVIIADFSYQSPSRVFQQHDLLNSIRSHDVERSQFTS